MPQRKLTQLIIDDALGCSIIVSYVLSAFCMRCPVAAPTSSVQLANNTEYFRWKPVSSGNSNALNMLA